MSYQFKKNKNKNWKKVKFNKNKSSNNKENSNFLTEYKKRFEESFGSGSFEKLLQSRKYFSNQFIRVNISKGFKKDVEVFLNKNRYKFSNTFITNAIKIEKSFFNITSSLISLAGKIYVQELGSQIPVNLINFNDFRGLKIKILDMAASPGSKTTQIADFCNFYNIEYEIFALEPNKERLNRLVNNIQKQEFENIKIFNVRGENFDINEKFDIILLDAPCSGNLVGDRNWLKKRDFKGIEKNSNLQKKLLRQASKLLTKNGVLIYSTCSLEIEENEENVLWAEKNLTLKSQPIKFKFGFEVNPENLFINKKLKKKFENINAVRIMPYLSKTQGFFCAVFKKN